MNDWRQRAKRLSTQPVDPPAIDKQALAKRVSDDTAVKAAILEHQRKFSRHLATTVVSNVIVELADTIAGENAKPVIEEHHKRMLSVTAEIKNKPIVVNVLALPSGRTRLTCFIGVDGDGREQEFDLPAKDEDTAEWLGNRIVEFFEHEPV